MSAAPVNVAGPLNVAVALPLVKYTVVELKIVPVVVVVACTLDGIGTRPTEAGAAVV